MEPWDRRLSEFVYNFARADTAEEFRRTLAHGIGELISTELAAYTEVDLISQRVFAVANAPVPRPEETQRRLGQLAHQHPLIRRGLVGAHAISDYLTARRFHALELYQDVYRVLGAEDQMAIELPPTREGIVIGLALNRSRRGFDAHARELLSMLQPLIAGGHQRVLARERARGVLSELELGAEHRPGVVACRADGQVEFVSDLARTLLASYFQGSRGGALPEALCDWLGTRPPCGERITVAGPRGWLDIHLLASGPHEPRLLELRERRSSARGSLLTAREHQIVARLAAGESNQEIARALGVSQRTVENHLRSAYRKLGVSNRTAAAAALGEAGIAAAGPAAAGRRRATV